MCLGAGPAASPHHQLNPPSKRNSLVTNMAIIFSEDLERLTLKQLLAEASDRGNLYGPRIRAYREMNRRLEKKTSTGQKHFRKRVLYPYLKKIGYPNFVERMEEFVRDDEWDAMCYAVGDSHAFC